MADRGFESENVAVKIGVVCAFGAWVDGGWVGGGIVRWNWRQEAGLAKATAGSTEVDGTVAVCCAPCLRAMLRE